MFLGQNVRSVVSIGEISQELKSGTSLTNPNVTVFSRSTLPSYKSMIL